MATLLLVIAKLGYGVGIGTRSARGDRLHRRWSATLAFACIGYAVSGLIGSPDAAQPVVQATMMPLCFISGV